MNGLDRSGSLSRADELLKRFGSANIVLDKARSLSPVNRRRVELVRAMLHEPGLIVVDGASAGLDDAERRDLLADMHRAKSENESVLWTTQLPDEAESADRVVALHRGHILFDGTPDELTTSQEANDLTAAFARLVGDKAV
jgi:ABC-2 type transport system ATP-binding protein